MSGGSPARLQRDLTTLFQVGTAAGLSDRELLGRIHRSSFEEAEASFQALVTRHGPMVLRVCRNVLGDSHDAEDAFQATFLVLVKRYRTIRNRDSIGSWLYGVAARVSARARVEAARRRKHEHGARRLAVVPAPADDGPSGLTIQEEVLRLPERYRSVVVLCYWEGLTHEQAAARLACPLGTVRSRMARARDLLRKRLVRRGVAPGVDVDSAPTILPLSSALVQSTVQAAAKVASGQVIFNVVAAQIATLSLQLSRRMVVMKIGMASTPACLVLAASIGLGVGAQTAKRTNPDGNAPLGSRAPARETTPRRPPMKEYIVEPPDVLRVEVLEALPGRPLSGEKVVRPDGRISLGFYGELSVAGLTIPEIKKMIVLHMRKYLTDEVLGLFELDPETGGPGDPIDPKDSDRVLVELVASNSKVYYVLGEVPRPGKFPLTGRDTILDAVALVGGLTSRSDRGRVFLVRKDPKEGELKKLPVHLDEITTGGDPSTNYPLQNGDRLVVYRDPKSQDEQDRRSPTTSPEKNDADLDESELPKPAPGLEGKVEGLERRLSAVERQLSKVLERLGEPR